MKVISASFLKVFYALSLFAWTTNAEAATYWVSDSKGDDSNPCFDSATKPTQNSQFRKSISWGIGCLSSGDTLYIEAGTYKQRISSSKEEDENTCSLTSASPAPAKCIPSGISAASMTTISAAPGDERKVAICQGSVVDNCIAIEGFHKYIAIKGLLVWGFKPVGATSGTRQILHRAVEVGSCPWNENKAPSPNETSGSTHLDLRQECKEVDGKNGSDAEMFAMGRPLGILVESNEVAWAKESGAHVCSAGGVFRGNWFHHNGVSGQDHGIYVSGHCTIEYNDIGPGNSGFGVQNWSEPGKPVYNVVVRNNYIHDNGHGITIGPWFDHQVYGNIVARNRGSGIRCGGENAKCYNNTVYKNGLETDPGPSGCIYGGDDSQMYNNLCVDNVRNVEGNGMTSNNVYTESSPFVDPENGEFQLVAATPSGIKDAGMALGAPWDFDANGVARPQGVGWDVGACEYFAGASKCPSLQFQAVPDSAPASPTALEVK